jgi:hypothetical protein
MPHVSTLTPVALVFSQILDALNRVEAMEFAFPELYDLNKVKGVCSK